MANLIDRAVESFKRVGEGLKTVFIHSFREPTTQEYPDKIQDLAAHFRGRLALAVNPDTGDHLCISCRQCERVCPDKCIEITAHKSPETNKLELIDFKIDHGLCMFCGLCTEVCPTTCIINTNDFEMADYTRESLIYDIKRLTLTQDESTYYFDKKEMPRPKPKAPPKPAAAAGAAGAAAKPAAAAGDPAAKAAAAKAAAAKAAAAKAAAAKADGGEAKADAPKAEAKSEEKVAEPKADAAAAKKEVAEAKSEEKAAEAPKKDEKDDKKDKKE
ncbi:MAG: NADH-quinone oxidoreductase subunit I [Candidatus Obscuribacterales bacterium]|nr:NADH-quinone oxidoreductase subunit I [Candidatus Obscuribacterales bacterium]